MPDISLPTGILLSPFATRISKWLYLETYLTSHRAYLRRNGFLVRWHKLGAGLEVSFSLESVLEHDRVPSARIAVRSTQSAQPIEKVTLLVEANAAYGIHQDVITLHRLSNRILVAALPSVPLRTVYPADNLQFFDSFNRLTVSVIEMLPTSLNADLSNATYTISPMNVDLLNDRFEDKWGTFWNLAEIDSKIQMQAEWLRYHLVQPKFLYASNADIPPRAYFAGIVRGLFGQPICWLLSRSWLLKLYFWLPIFMRLHKLEINDG